MERSTSSAIATFLVADALAAGVVVTLGREEAHHARVRRLAAGDCVRLVDGRGLCAEGELCAISSSSATVRVETVEPVRALPAVHLVVPIADRDRMLWLAEKATELGVTSWRPACWHRSRSVMPRGEGSGFAARVRARMVGALTQSRGAWLPELHPDAPLERAIAGCSGGTRLLLDIDGPPLAAERLTPPVSVAAAPEGGMERAEREALVAAGFRPVNLGPLVLRFETAIIAALAIVRSTLAVQLENARDY
ncbi:MAG TPA: RsmE family RNA methyltransferase [Gemmatimonadaceae bacterium]|nr:RsmE family RNA methyltransferase [Gemmatimonadaceae bacterium]